MDYLLGGPGRYVQGPGLLGRLGQYTAPLGRGVFLITDPAGKQRIQQELEEGLPAEEPLVWALSEGPCCEQEAERLAAEFAASGCGVIAGAGGGRQLDLAKAAAYKACAPCALLPTVASTDAPCSALAVLYTPEGLFQRYLYLGKSPELVAVDTAQIAKAPAHLLVWGMGDALSTWFEARACARAGAPNELGGAPGGAALCLAAQCWQTLRQYGPAALEQAKRKTPGSALEKIVEANIYLSGLGFESGGLAAAHGINNALAALPAGQKSAHGEKVAFGTLVQLVLERELGEYPEEAAKDLEAALTFCRSVGLPTTLTALGFDPAHAQIIKQIAALALAPQNTLSHLPFAVNGEQLARALLTAHRLGAAEKRGACPQDPAIIR